MGFLDFIGNKIQQVNAESQQAQMEAEHWKAKKICYELKKTSSIPKCTGYMKVLKNKCIEMDDNELENLFDEVYYQQNKKACLAILPIMKSRDLIETDDDGKLHRNY